MGPVTTGSLLSRGFWTFRQGFGSFVTLALIFYSPMILLRILIPVLQPLGPVLTTASTLILTLGPFLLMSIASAAVVYGVFQGLRGQPTAISKCISVVAQRSLAILVLTFLTGLVTGVGYVMCIIPGIVLTYGLFLAGPVLIVEKLDAVEAMRRSWALTDGYKLVIFFVSLGIGVLQIAVLMALNLVFGLDTFNQMDSPSVLYGVYDALSDLMLVIFLAFNAVISGVAYHDLRIFREGLDDDDLISVFE